MSSQTDEKVADKDCDNKGFVDVAPRVRDSADFSDAGTPDRPCPAEVLTLSALLSG